MKVRKTERGFVVGEFKDSKGCECSLQESSIATERAVWLGIDDADPQILLPERGWSIVPFPEGTLFNTRMHLNQKNVQQLLPYLKYFARFGTLPQKRLSASKSKKR